MTRIISSVILLIIPVLLAITSLHTINERGNIWYNGDYDPAYAYLYNSLNITNGLAPGHYDHPGTTMQVIGAVALKVSWMVDHNDSENLTRAVINDPEHYLRILNIVVAVLCSAFIFFLGIVVFRFSDNLLYSLLFQATPFISGLVLYNGFCRLSQESMLMVSSLTLAAFAIGWYFKQDRYSLKKWAVIFGVISGFGIVSKIIFLPLMLIPIFLLRTRKHILTYLITTIISFIVLTIPIVIRYPSMAWWFVNLLIHSGIYGAGDISVIDSSKYIDSLIQLFKGNPVYSIIFIITATALLAFMIRQKLANASKKHNDLIIILAVFLVQAAGFIITAKHPKVAYLLPYELLVCIPLIIIIDRTLSYRRSLFINYLIKGIIILPLIYFGARNSISQKKKLYFNDKLKLNEQAWDIARSSGKAVIAVNPGPSPVSAMFFGNVYAADKYSNELEQSYPDRFIFDTYKNSIVNWQRQTLTFRELIERYDNNVAVVGYDVDFLRPLIMLNKDITMEKQVFGKTEVAILTPRK